MKNHNLSQQSHQRYATSSSAYRLYEEEQELQGVEAFINRYRQPIEQILTNIYIEKKSKKQSC